jgi:hypothetical protein
MRTSQMLSVKPLADAGIEVALTTSSRSSVCLWCALEVHCCLKAARLFDRPILQDSVDLRQKTAGSFAR